MRADSPMYRLSHGRESACSNVHNVAAAKGQAGARDRFPRVQPGEALTVAELQGPAIITRLWLTFDWPGTLPYPESTRRNRSVSLEITWDDATTPAIRVPVGDFFGHPLSYDLPFENAFFESPAGRSLLCFIPMPFRQRALIRIVNEFDQPITVFHDIRLTREPALDADDGYLHACFSRTLPSEPGRRHHILPLVQGRGRYLGTQLGVITDRFNPLHWHGAQPAFYIDGDSEYPSILGASLDDFAGASWAYETPFMHQDSGLLLSRRFPLGGGHYGFYCYHRRDPIYFADSCAVAIRPKLDLAAADLLATLTACPGLIERLAMPLSLAELQAAVAAGSDAWYECGRLDDLASVAYYYLDRPEGDHPLAPLDLRCAPACQWPADDAQTLLP